MHGGKVHAAPVLHPARRLLLPRPKTARSQDGRAPFPQRRARRDVIGQPRRPVLFGGAAEEVPGDVLQEPGLQGGRHEHLPGPEEPFE